MNDIRVKNIRAAEDKICSCVADIAINGVTICGINVTLEDNGTYPEVFFKVPMVNDGFGIAIPSVELPVDMEMEIRERLKEALFRNGRRVGNK